VAGKIIFPQKRFAVDAIMEGFNSARHGGRKRAGNIP
jgi:hypothetical protein